MRRVPWVAVPVVVAVVVVGGRLPFSGAKRARDPGAQVADSRTATAGVCTLTPGHFLASIDTMKESMDTDTYPLTSAQIADDVNLAAKPTRTMSRWTPTGTIRLTCGGGSMQFATRGSTSRFESIQTAGGGPTVFCPANAQRVPGNEEPRSSKLIPSYSKPRHPRYEPRTRGQSLLAQKPTGRTGPRISVRFRSTTSSLSQ